VVSGVRRPLDTIAVVPGGGAPTAVVVDRWPLVRLGIAGALRACGVVVVAESAKASEGLLLTRSNEADLLVLGSPGDGLNPATIRTVKRDADGPRVVALVAAATGPELRALFTAGADALLVASTSAADLGDAVTRLMLGERVVGANLGMAFTGGTGEAGTGSGRPSPTLLTGKETEVLALLAQGHSNKQIARALYVSEATVKTHLAHVYAKLEVQSRHHALSRAVELGLLG
jgi:DNA-binding NarL/FixJ family response regulator